MRFHTLISLIKSVLRIAGAVYLLFNLNMTGIFVFALTILLAEVLGVIEELKEDW